MKGHVYQRIRKENRLYIPYIWVSKTVYDFSYSYTFSNIQIDCIFILLSEDSHNQ
jgi:hypothetical protein